MRNGGAILTLLLIACSNRPNPKFCDENADCKNGFTCNLETHGCDAVSDAGIDANGTCALDDECPSGVCNANACEPAENVLYVATDGISAGSCGEDSRCDLIYALSIATTERHTIRLQNGVYEPPSDVVVDQTKPSITIVGGRAAVFRRAVPGPALEAAGNPGPIFGPTLTLRGMTLNKGVRCQHATLELYDVIFDNPSGETFAWVSADDCKVGIYGSQLKDSPQDGVAGTSLDLTIARSTISSSARHGVLISPGTTGLAIPGINVSQSLITENKNIGINISGNDLFKLERSTISFNKMGGVKVSGSKFDITNNFIMSNGQEGNTLGVDSSHFGGVSLVGLTIGNSRVVHNTIAFNWADFRGDGAGGIYCDNASAAYNIIASNFRGNAKLEYAQTRGICLFAGSLVTESYQTPGFVSPGIPYDLHILASSPALDMGGTPSVVIDFDGDLRSDGSADLGADERL